MSYPHTIRLRGPWQYEVVERFDAGSDPGEPHASGRVKLPCNWNEPPWGDFCGRARFTRTFNWPEPLEPHEQLSLMFDVGADCVIAELNGKRLVEFKSKRPVRVDISGRVEISNTLAIAVQRSAKDVGDARSSSPDFIREIYLEVTERTR